MIWHHSYDPLGSPLASTLVAATPLVVLLGLLAFAGWSGLRAAAAGLVAAMLIAAVVIGMPGDAVVMAAVHGALFGLFPIGWIVVTAMFLYRLSAEAGAIDVMKCSVMGLSADHRLQALLIAFSFGGFLEGAAGFGAPVAISAALMVGAGFPAVEAACLALIANTAPVAFGALGTPIITLAKVTGLEEQAISTMAGQQLPLFSLLVPAWMVCTMAGWRGLIGVWPAVLVCGASFAVTQFAMATFVGAALVDVVAGVTSLVAVATFLRFWRPASIWRHDDGWNQAAHAPTMTVNRSDPIGRVAWAWMPWALLSITVFLWGLPPVKAVLDGRGLSLPLPREVVAPEFPVPWLDGRIAKVPPATREPYELERAVYRLNWLSAAGTGILVAAVASVFWLGISWRRAWCIWWENLRGLSESLATIAAMLALAFVTRFSGTDVTLGIALTGTGAAYPFFAPLLGWLGVALTGSDTSSNAMFGSLQRVTAEQLGLDPILICTANSTGGVMGKMIDAQSIVVSATATGTHRQEGTILRRVFPHSLALAALMGLLVWLQAGPLGWMVPVAKSAGTASRFPPPEPGPMSARAADLLARCLAVEPARPTFAKEAMVPSVARILANKDAGRAVTGWLAAAEQANRTAAPKPPSTIPDPFNKHALVHAWMLCRASPHVPPDTAAKIAAATKEYVCRYGHREWRGYGALNFRLMSDGAALLAAEQWPDLIDADGLDSAGILAATRQRLLGYFDEIVHRNSAEYGAPTYSGVNLVAMKMLADFAHDETVRHRATLTLDTMLLHVACAWNRGYHVSPASRAKFFAASMTGPDAMDCTAAIGWLCFGAERPVAGLCEQHSGWFAFPGTYEPPAILARIAAARAEPFTHRGSRGDRLRHTIHHEQAYALASGWERLETPRDHHYKESRRQMLKWVSDSPQSSFMPFQDNAHRPYDLAENKANSFGYGENPFSQSLQHGRTLVGLTAVPDDYPYWRIEVPFSTTGSIVKRLDRAGWICCHAGSMLFAFHLLGDARWADSRSKERCDVLTSDARRTGWILETSPLADFAGGGTDAELDRFATAVVARTTVDASRLAAQRPRLTYTSLAGNVLDITYRPHGEPYVAQHTIDGVAVDYDSFPLLGNPWVHQDLDGEDLVIEHDTDGLRYDFRAWTRHGSR